MQKKLLSTAALLIAAGITVPAFAQFTISAGVQSTELQVNTETMLRSAEKGLQNFLATTTREGVASDEAINVGGELALGYQYNFNPTYNVAFEVFGQLAATQTEVPILADLSNTVAANEAVASFDWIAGLRIRPGYYVTPTTRLFIDGGIVWGDFEVEYDDAFAINTGGGAAENITLVHDSDSETLLGWRYGAGIEHNVTDNFAIGVDYTITQFDDYSSDALEDTAEAHNAPGTVNTEYTPELYILGLNFKYLFGAKQKQHYEMRDK